MRFSTYKEWKDHKIDEARKSCELFDCPECNGGGDVDCDCDCPHCEYQMPCECCDGSDQVTVDELEDHSHWAVFYPTQFGYGQYHEEIISTIHDWCSWTGQNFLDCFSEFIKFLKKHGGMLP